MQRYTYGRIEDAEPYSAEDGSRVISFFVFNTDVHFHVYPAGGGGMPVRELDDALLACRDRCLHFEGRLSRTRADSDLARAHAASPRPVDVAPETAELVALARSYCDRSRGCFDITMGTVTRLWDFHEGVVPSSLELARVLPHVGVDKVRVDLSGPVPRLSIEDRDCVLDLGVATSMPVPAPASASARRHRSRSESVGTSSVALPCSRTAPASSDTSAPVSSDADRVV